MHAKGRTRVSHHVLNATLVHRNNIGVALHHVHAIFFGNGFLTLKDAIQFVVFVVNVRVGRVYILLLYAFCARVEQPSAKTNHLSAYAKPRKYNTAGKAIDIPSVVGTIAKSRLYQEFHVISLVFCRARQ